MSAGAPLASSTRAVFSSPSAGGAVAQTSGSGRRKARCTTGAGVSFCARVSGHAIGPRTARPA
eukprot:1350813-Alexandrium_andersonii.AAC.1